MNVRLKHISEVAKDALQNIEDRRSGNVLGLKTSLPLTNKYLDGAFEFGEIMVIGGRPGHGKSAFVLRLVEDFCALPENQSMKDKFIIIFWSFEMPNEQHLYRLFSANTLMSVSKIRSTEKALVDDDFKRIQQYAEKFKHYPVMMCDIPQKSSTIMEANKRFRDENPDKFIINVIDHSRLTKPDPKIHKVEEQKITDLYVESVAVANEYKSSFITLSQLNRSIESVERLKAAPNGLPWAVPVGSDLFGADGATQCAHKIHILLRPYEMCKMDEVMYFGNNLKLRKQWTKEGVDPILCQSEIMMNYIVKSRFGPTGEVIYETNLAINKFKEYSF